MNPKWQPGSLSLALRVRCAAKLTRRFFHFFITSPVLSFPACSRQTIYLRSDLTNGFLDLTLAIGAGCPLRGEGVARRRNYGFDLFILDKGKPVARRGRKVMGPLGKQAGGTTRVLRPFSETVARLPKG
jgi:hypothetical protein